MNRAYARFAGGGLEGGFEAGAFFGTPLRPANFRITHTLLGGVLTLMSTSDQARFVSTANRCRRYA